MVSLQSVTTALYKAAFIAGATAGGGPAAGATATSFVNSPAGEGAIAKAVTITLGENNVDSGNFAMGGLVMSPTLAMIGDNPSGREAVIPFERMGEFLGQVAGGNQNMNVTGKIQGHDIVLSQERAMRQRGR